LGFFGDWGWVGGFGTIMVFVDLGGLEGFWGFVSCSMVEFLVVVVGGVGGAVDMNFILNSLFLFLKKFWIRILPYGF
jgi:hypothetical protein